MKVPVPQGYSTGSNHSTEIPSWALITSPLQGKFLQRNAHRGKKCMFCFRDKECKHREKETSFSKASKMEHIFLLADFIWRILPNPTFVLLILYLPYSKAFKDHWGYCGTNKKQDCLLNINSMKYSIINYQILPCINKLIKLSIFVTDQMLATRWTQHLDMQFHTWVT